jgi:hypothetical protein
VHAQNTPVIKLSQSAQQVWQRQQVLITLEVITDDPFARLEVDSFKQQGFSIIPFDLQRVESNKQTILTLKWAIFPFVSGKHLLQLPRVRYRPNSGRKQTLALKTPSLTVRRLPVYVPPTMPIGKIELVSYWDEGWLVSTGELLEWKLKVIGNGVAEQTMPPLSRQLTSNQSAKIFLLKSTKSTFKTDAGINQQKFYTIPLKASNSGLLNLPNIEVQYFEPNSGKLEKVFLNPPFTLALNKWLQIFIIISFVVLLGVLITIGFKNLKRVYRKRKKQKQALHKLSQATDYAQIRTALNQFTSAKGWGENLALERLPMLHAHQGEKSTRLKDTVNKLQAIEFSQQGSNVEITEVINDLIKILK